MRIYAIKDEATGSYLGEFPTIKAAIQFIHKHYAGRKISMWRYEDGKYTRVIYQ